jgi:hypothetical protein
MVGKKSHIQKIVSGYVPPVRSPLVSEIFQAFEKALPWYFSKACYFHIQTHKWPLIYFENDYHFSLDNLCRYIYVP